MAYTLSRSYITTQYCTCTVPLFGLFGFNMLNSMMQTLNHNTDFNEQYSKEIILKLILKKIII